MSRIARLTIVVTASLGCARATSHGVSLSAARVSETPIIAVIHAFDQGLDGAKANAATVTLHAEKDTSLQGERVLRVDYPAKGSDPAARDVRLDARVKDWSMGQAVAFQVRAAHTMRMSLSFIDRNGVLYTTWVNVQGEKWQHVRIAFGDMRSNPYFQPPMAKKGAPLDLSNVPFIAFAPQEDGSGDLSITRIALVR